MRGVWYGMFGINLFAFVILMQGFGAGVVSIYYPVAIMATMVLCVWAAETQKGDDKDDPDNS